MKFLPDTLAGRLFLILVGGVVLAVSLTYALVHWERTSELTTYRQRTDAERLASMVRLIDAMPAEARNAAQQAMDRQRMRISFVPPVDQSDGTPASAVADALGAILGGERLVNLSRLGEEPCRFNPATTEAVGKTIDCRATIYRVNARLQDGTPLSIEASLRSLRPEPFFVRPYAALLFVGLVIVSVLLAVRVATRPLRRLEQAAEALGQNLDRPPLDESGPRELQLAARTFNAMQARIHAYVAERTHMLAAITHDLKTPLTRMRLRIEQVTQEPLRAKLAQDVAGMLGLIDDGLALARSHDDGTPLLEVDLRSLVDSLCADALEAGVEVKWESGFGSSPPVRVKGRPDSLRRVFANLIDNASKYAGRVTVKLAVEKCGEAPYALVSMQDNGPGIPERHLNDVLRPFFRAEQSRSRDTGGSGLGLSIAANILRAHGGDLELCNRPAGGLEVRVRLPALDVAKNLRALSNAATEGKPPA